MSEHDEAIGLARGVLGTSFIIEGSYERELAESVLALSAENEELRELLVDCHTYLVDQRYTRQLSELMRKVDAALSQSPAGRAEETVAQAKESVSEVDVGLPNPRPVAAALPTAKPATESAAVAPKWEHFCPIAAADSGPLNPADTWEVTKGMACYLCGATEPSSDLVTQGVEVDPPSPSVAAGETPTPRTDEHANIEVHRGINNKWETETVSAHFARQLERELAAARRKNEAILKESKSAIQHNKIIAESAERELAALKKRLEDAGGELPPMPVISGHYADHHSYACVSRMDYEILRQSATAIICGLRLKLKECSRDDAAS